MFILSIYEAYVTDNNDGSRMVMVYDTSNHDRAQTTSGRAVLKVLPRHMIISTDGCKSLFDC